VAIDATQAAALAQTCEAAAMQVDKRITNSEGAGVSAQQAHFWAGNSRGFRGGYSSSRHYLSVSPIAARARTCSATAGTAACAMPANSPTPHRLGVMPPSALWLGSSRAGCRLLRCRAVRVDRGSGLLGAFVQATSGGALYRKTSFLVDCLGQQVLADHIDIEEDPHQPKGKGSAPFDDEGVRTRARHVVQGGVVQGYFLSSYSARKLNMRTTGNAGGSQNLSMTSRRTKPADNLDAMLRKLGRGLFVTELMGQGINYVTGDYSRGAAGFWVEGGRIVHPVNEVTIAAT
jgi:PmbA protein